MAEKFKVHIEAERFIHNELGSVAFHLMQLVHTKIAEDDKEGIGLLMIACLTFFAFEVEAQVNFVGWKVFGDDWKEREKLERKINILCAKLAMKNDWTERPLETIKRLKDLRDTLAHGKPEIVDEQKVVDVEPEVWDALESQWLETVTPEFVDQSNEDTKALWHTMLKCAGIGVHETLTGGGHSLSKITH